MVKINEYQSFLTYLKTPKELVHGEQFKDLPSEAILMYTLMFDRLTLSIKNKWVDDDGEVYQYFTIDELETLLRATRPKVIKTKKLLKNKGLIREVRQGQGRPNKIYVEKVTENLNLQKSQYVLQEVTNRHGTKTEYIKTDNTNNIMSVCTDIIAYLNDKTGANYRASSKTTQRLIKARLKEGYGLDDFKAVIDTKTSDWLRDSKMSQYLRPETLFGNKFESYLNQGKPRRSGNQSDERLGF